MTDGYRDFVMLGGSHGKDGRVTVVYGTSAGPGARVQTIHQDSAGIPGPVEAEDGWGSAAVTADPDRDGYADLVVSSPGEDSGTIRSRGGPTVVRGGAKGLGPGTVFNPPVPQEYEGQGDHFGEDMVSGDFDGDGDQDLAVTSNSRSGVVLLKGPFTRTGGRSGWDPLGGSYGYLVAGRVTADAATDLYILGMDLQDGSGDLDLRAYFHRGGSTFTQRAGALRVPDDGGHRSGDILSVGGFDKDGYGDLAIGRGYETGGGERGYVTVQYGGSGGPDTARKPVRFSQNTTGVPGSSENGGLFGSAIAAGDVNGDGYADLAVGVRGEDLGTKRDAGTVTVLLGRTGGLSGTGAKPCYAYSRPYPRAGADAQAPLPWAEETSPQAVLMLKPGQSAYTGVLTYSPDGEGGGDEKALGVTLADRKVNATGEERTLRLPNGGTFFNSAATAVTYWQGNAADALSR